MSENEKDIYKGSGAQMKGDENYCSHPETPVGEKSNRPKITVEYERVGSFHVFETICPLEFSGFAELPVVEVERVTIPKRKPNKKALKTISIVENLSSESEDELTAAYNRKMSQPPPLLMPIYLDTFFRTENPASKEPVEGQATVFWAKGDSTKISKSPKEDDSESDLDPDIAKYIAAQKDKKYKGENLTGEELWYDQDRSLIRNLHTDGSISLTSYGDTDEKIFGKTEIFDEILTAEERAMLRARNTDEMFLKAERKKKNSECRKGKKQCSRPKDQGDWL